MKIIIRLFIFSLFLISYSLLPSPALALTLDTIGTSATTGGKPTAIWNYTSVNPILTGTAVASSTITITIDSIPYTASANSTGTWTYIPTTLTAGSHTMTITGDTIISFTLNINATASPSPSPTTLPVSGSTDTTFILIAAGFATLTLGLYFALRPALIPNP